MKKLLLFKIFLFQIFCVSLAFGINIQQTERSHSLTFEKLEDARSSYGHVTRENDFLFYLGGSFVDEPLVVKDPSNGSQFSAVVQNMIGAHFGASYFFKEWLSLGFDSSYSFYESNDGRKFSGLTDPKLRAKIRVVNKRTYAVALMPFASFDFGFGDREFQIRDSGFTNLDGLGANSGLIVKPLKDNGMGYGLTAIYEKVFKSFQFVINLGYQYSSNAILFDLNNSKMIDYRHLLLTGIGAYIPVARTWGINLEYSRKWSLPLGNQDLNPNELYLGTSFGLTQTLHGFAGLGFGNNILGNDGNDYRASLGIKWAPKIKKSYQKKMTYTKPLKEQGEPIKKLKASILKESRSCSPNIFGETNNLIIRFENNVVTPHKVVENRTLETMIERLRDNIDNIESITISGHASHKGSSSYNIDLAKERSQNIRKYLKFKGISDDMITVESYGENRHIDLGVDDLAQARNRRVEVFVSPKANSLFCY